MASLVENGLGDTSSNPGRDCILHRANTIGKNIDPIILPPPMVGQTELFNFGMATSLGKEKL